MSSSPILDWLQSLGWRFIAPEDLGRDTDDPFDLRALSTAIKKLNQGVIERDEDVEKVINQLRRIPNDIEGNREFFEWLKGEHGLVLKQGTKDSDDSISRLEQPRKQHLDSH